MKVNRFVLVSVLAQPVPAVPVREEPEVPEPINPVPAIMLGAFVVFAVGMAAIGAYASFHGDAQVALMTTIATLVGLSGYQSWVIARQRRTITHLTLSVDGLMVVVAGNTSATTTGGTTRGTTGGTTGGQVAGTAT